MVNKGQPPNIRLHKLKKVFDFRNPASVSKKKKEELYSSGKIREFARSENGSEVFFKKMVAN